MTNFIFFILGMLCLFVSIYHLSDMSQPSEVIFIAYINNSRSEIFYNQILQSFRFLKISTNFLSLLIHPIGKSIHSLRLII